MSVRNLLVCGFVAFWLTESGAAQDVFDLRDSLDTGSSSDFDFETGDEETEWLEEENREALGKFTTPEKLIALSRKDVEDLAPDEVSALRAVALERGLLPSTRSLLFPDAVLRRSQTEVSGLSKSELEDRIDTLLGEGGASEATQVEKPFWEKVQRSAEFDFGYASNPAKKKGGDDDIYGSITINGEETHYFRNKEGGKTGYSWKMNGQLKMVDYLDDVGSDGSGLSVATSFGRKFDHCWSVSVNGGVDFAFEEVFDGWGSTEYPVGVAVKRNVLKKGTHCKAADGADKTDFTVKFSAAHVYASPAETTRNQYSFSLSKDYVFGKKADAPANKNKFLQWNLNVAPKVSEVDYKQLPLNEDRKDITVTLGITLTKAVKGLGNLRMKAELGDRDSTDPLRDTTFAKAPFTIALERQF